MTFILLVVGIYLIAKLCGKDSFSSIMSKLSGNDEFKGIETEKIPAAVIYAFIAIMVMTNPFVILFIIGFYNFIGIAFIAAVQSISTIIVYNFCKEKSEESIKTLNNLIFTKGYAPKRVQPFIRRISEFRVRIIFYCCALLLIVIALYGFSWIPNAAKIATLGLFDNVFTVFITATVVATILFICVLKVRLMDSFLVKKYGVEFCFIDGYFKCRYENDLMNSIHWGIILNMIGSQLFMQFSKSVSHASFMANVSSSALSFIVIYVVMNIFMKNPSRFRYDVMKKALVFYTCGLNSDNPRIKEYFLSKGALQNVANDEKINQAYEACVRLYKTMFLTEEDMLKNTVKGDLGLVVRSNQIYRQSDKIRGGVPLSKNPIQSIVDKCSDTINAVTKREEA